MSNNIDQLAHTDWLSLIDRMSGLFLIFDKKQQVLAVSKACSNYLSINTDCDDTFLSSVFSHEDVNTISLLQDGVAEHSPVLMLEHQDIDWELSALNSTGLFSLVGNFKENKKEVQDSSWMSRMIEIFPGNCWWKNKKGIYMGCNSFLANNLNMSPGDLIGKTDFDLPWKNQAAMLSEHDTKVMNAKTKESHIETVEGIDGSTFHFYVTKAALKNSDGETIGTIGASIDITELKETQEKLKIALDQAQIAARTKDSVIENLRHDWITPFCGMVGVTQAGLDTEKNP